MSNCENNMIYKIESREIVAIEISIFFENDKNKVVTVSKDDLVEVTYIDENTKLKTIRGKVSDCNEIFITIDHSSLFNSNITEIYIKEIRDIDKRTSEIMPLS